MKIVYALLLLLSVTRGDRAYAEGGAFAPSGVCRADAAFGPSPRFVNFEAQAVTLGQSRINCGLGRLSTTSPTKIFIDYRDQSAASNITCALYVNDWGNTRYLYGESHTSVGVGTSYFSYTIPAQVIGYITVLCDLPVFASADTSPSKFFGINFQ